MFLRSFLSVSGMTFLSRLLGLWRDVIIANVFGAGAHTDAFFAAFRLPNMLRRFTAEGAMTQAFVPMYSERAKQSMPEAKRLAGEVGGGLLLILLTISLLGIFVAPWIIGILAPGLEAKQIAVNHFRIVFPYILFISLVAWAGGILNAQKRFLAVAAAPMLLNIVLVVMSLYFVDFFAIHIDALAWGVLIGGGMQLAWVLWHLKRAELWPSFHYSFSPEIKKTLSLFWRSAVGAGSAQINLLINLFIASFLASGSISWLYYADRLMELPTGLLGAALATVVLPSLADKAKDAKAFSDLLDLSLRLILILSLPAAVGLAYLSLPLVATLFLNGEFTVKDAMMTERAVLAYSMGVLGLVAIRPLAAAFFSRQDATVPVRAALLMLFVTQLLNFIFIFIFHLEHIGLALSISVAACMNALILYIVLLRRGWYQISAGWVIFLLRILCALVMMIIILWFLTPEDEFWLNANTYSRVLSLGGIISAAIVGYFFVAYIVGLRIRDFRLKI